MKSKIVKALTIGTIYTFLYEIISRTISPDGIAILMVIPFAPLAIFDLFGGFPAILHILFELICAIIGKRFYFIDNCIIPKYQYLSFVQTSESCNTLMNWGTYITHFLLSFLVFYIIIGIIDKVKSKK